MRELQRKQKMRRIVYSFPSIILLLIISFFLAKGAAGVLIKERESSKRSRELEDKMVMLSVREQELKKEILGLETEEGIKGEIKERFNVTAEGEQVAVIVDDKRNASSTDKSLWPWYKKLWSAIIGSND